MPSSKPSIAELRAVCQPGALLGRRSAEHWAGRLYMRRVSLRVTRRLIDAPVSANALTGLMMVAGLAGAAIAAVPTLWAAVATALLVQLYLLLDCSDGEVARWRGTTSPTGVYLDRIGHYVVEAALFVGIGLRAEEGWVGPWAMLGLAGALLVVLKKAESDLVVFARASAGLPSPDDEAATPRAATLRGVRAAVARVPLHQVVGGVEMSLLLLAAAAVDAATGSLAGTRGLLAGASAIAAMVVVGHLVMILASNRLR